MSKALKYWYQKEKQDEIFNPNFQTVIWSDLEYLELVETVDPISVDSGDHSPINVKWEESSRGNDYDKPPEIKVSVINNIQNINPIINNIEIQQNFSITEGEKEVINLSGEGEENPKVKVKRNKGEVFSSKKIQPKLISRLHEDIYNNDPFLKTLILNPFVQGTTLFICSMLIPAFLFSNKANLIQQNTSFNPQNLASNELNNPDNMLDINNLAQIPIENSRAKVEPKLANHSQINPPVIPPLPKSENLQNLPQNVSQNLMPLATALNQNQVIMDRYYISQNNPQNKNSNLPNQNTITVMDRYYVQGNQNIPAQNSPSPSPVVEVKSAVNRPSSNVVSQLPPPPPLLETNSSIPTFSPIVNPEIAQNIPINQNEKTNQTYLLQGVMNFEENSAALFKTGETVLHINLGESIGNQGWILEKLENGQAILSKNGEILSLRVGESFSINLD